MNKDRFGTFLAVASLALAALVLLLAWQNRGLKQELSVCLAGRGMPSDALAEGDLLPSLPVIDPDGNPAELDLASGVHVVLIYSSTCPACEQTLPIWNAWLDSGLLGEADAHAIRTDPPAAGAAAAPGPAVLRLPVYLADRQGSDPLRRVYAVPCTLVLGESGVVRVAVYGVPSDDDARRVREALGVS